MKLSHLALAPALALALSAAAPQVALAAPNQALEGWHEENGSWHYAVAGADATGWQLIGGKWFYFDARGAMATHWEKVDGQWYYFGSSGAMKTGWQKPGDAWYWLGHSGAMKTGWQKVGGVWYYFSEAADDTQGGMYEARWTPDGSWVGEDGDWVEGLNKGKRSGDLVIIHTNDTHGFDQKAEGVAGMASVAQLKLDFQAEGKEVLLFDAGDAMQGNVLVNISKGENAVKFMNAAGYDAMCIGNHEFDFGMARLLENVSNLDFPALCGNIVEDATGESPFLESCVFELDNGMKVGVFGLDTPTAKTSSAPRNTEGYSFLYGQDLYDKTQLLINGLRESGCELVVCLGHLSEEDDGLGDIASEVVRNTNGLDIFIDAHDHQVENQRVADRYGDEVVITETGCNLANVGVISVGAEDIEATLMPASALTKENPEVAALVKAAADEVDAQLSETVGSTDILMNGVRDEVRSSETNLGDFCADALLWSGQSLSGRDVDAALLNGGGVRDSIAPGDITSKTLRTVFPFDNELCLITVSGEQLLVALESASRDVPTPNGGFMQVAGIEYTIDTSKPFEGGELYPNTTVTRPTNPGGRVTITSVGGWAFNLDDKYTIATNTYIGQGGGDNCQVFLDPEVQATFESLDQLDCEALSSYLVIACGGEVPAKYAQPQGRITIK